MTISAPASDFHSALALSRRQLMAAFTVAALSACGALLPLSAQAATVEESVLELQHDWEVVKYQTAGSEREKRYEALADKAHKISEAHAGRAEPLIWEGIIVASWAGEKGGLGALSLAKKAKAMYEASIALDANALDGSAYNSLGVLYYKVPGWPIGFGDKDKARDLIQKALAINPKGIDPNFFYGEFLIDQERVAEGRGYLEKALKAAPRPGRELADQGRRQEIQALLKQIAVASR